MKTTSNKNDIVPIFFLPLSSKTSIILALLRTGTYSLLPDFRMSILFLTPSSDNNTAFSC